MNNLWEDVGWCGCLFHFCPLACSVPSARGALPPIRYLLLWTGFSRGRPNPNPLSPSQCLRGHHWGGDPKASVVGLYYKTTARSLEEIKHKTVKRKSPLPRLPSGPHAFPEPVVTRKWGVPPTVFPMQLVRSAVRFPRRRSWSLLMHVVPL